MRRKITDTQDLPADELPSLTEKQMLFVQGILAGKTASDAYRSAYDCSNSEDRTIWANASRLRNDTNVSAWLSQARKAGLGRAAVTLESHLAELERLREIALDTGNVGAAVQAEQLRGKASGQYTENVRLIDDNPVDTLKTIQDEFGPDIAKLITQQLGASSLIEEQETRH